MKKFKIIVRGGYGFSNFGDDALMFTLHKRLIRLVKENEICYVCSEAPYLEKILGTATIIDFSKVNAQKLWANLLIYGGGTQFYEFPKNSAKAVIIENILSNPKLVMEKVKKKINFLLKSKNIFDNKFQLPECADHTALLGVGLGPFNESLTNSIATKTKNLLSKAGYVAVRDTYASQKCEEWGITHNLQTDICFALIESTLDITEDRDQIKKIGVIIRDWKYANGGAEYYNKLIKEVEDIRQNGFEVRFISFDTEADKEWHLKLNGLKEDFLLWNPQKSTISGFINKLKGFDLFITARYHGAIFSALLNKPFIGIEVEQKLSMISKLFENGADCWKIPFTQHKLLEKTLALSENYEESCKKVNQQKDLLRNDALEMFSEFEEFYKTIDKNEK